MSERVVRVLAVDGGGVRGILPAHVLAALEDMTGSPTAGLFDVMVGTSIGGIGVLALTRPDADGEPSCTAAELLEFFCERSSQIFPRGPINWPRSLRELEELVRRPSQSGAVLGFNREVGNARFSPQGLADALEARLGDTMLGEALTDVVVTSYDVRARRPELFRSADVRSGARADLPMRVVGMATAAAPTYFPAVEADAGDGESQILVDGGVFANAPALLAYAEGVAAAQRLGAAPDAIEVVSLGTGHPRPQPELTHGEYTGKSWFRLAEEIFEAAQVGQSQINDRVLTTLLGERYWRFDTELEDEAAQAMDNSDPENIAGLNRLGLAMVGGRIGDLHRLAARLG
jgi:patatin-like phospholipase/acyl hydrolase